MADEKDDANGGKRQSARARAVPNIIDRAALTDAQIAIGRVHAAAPEILHMAQTVVRTLSQTTLFAISVDEHRREANVRRLRTIYRCAVKILHDTESDLKDDTPRGGGTFISSRDYMPPDPSKFAVRLNPKTVFCIRQPGGRCETLRDFGPELLRILAHLVQKGCEPPVLARWLNEILQLAPVDIPLRDNANAVETAIRGAMKQSQWLDGQGNVAVEKREQIEIATAALRSVGITTQAWPEPFKNKKKGRSAAKPTKK